MTTELSAARPPLIRAMNEQLLLGHIRVFGPCSRADLARISGLSKPTVSLALANVEPEACAAAFGGDMDAQRHLAPLHLRSLQDFPRGLKAMVSQ